MPLVRSMLVAAILLISSAVAAQSPEPVSPTPEPASASPFGFEDVVGMARELAATPYDAPVADLPARLGNADYDAFRKLRFRADHALWHDEARFEVQFFHLGFLFSTPIGINVVDNGAATPLAFDPAMFDYGDSGLEPAPGAPLGFAGFRVHYPLHRPDYHDEVVVFLGASYFRFLGREQRYGLSARGLAVDTAMPRGEEFPLFRSFWLVKPGPEDTRLTIYALLDSPRITGAYRFAVAPGTDAKMEVTAHVFARADIDKLGLAPLTSMHLFGENALRAFDDYRPEVHDSDGLLMRTGTGRWLWRPLANARDLRVSRFVDRDPMGFGLFQRDRRFANYQDTEATYDRRPSYWIAPGEGWGEGGVELVEIPSAEEIHDNIVAFWVPKQPVRAGDELRHSYTLTTTLRKPHEHVLGRVVDTRVGSARVPGTDEKQTVARRRFVVDFDDGDLPFLGAGQEVEADLMHSRGAVRDLTVTRVPENGIWRATFRLDLEDADTAELALTLMLDGEPVSETWLYRVSR